VLALAIAFLAAVAIARFRFRGRKAFLATILIVQMIPAEALVISLFRVLDGWQLVNTIIGLSLTYLVFVLPFTIWTLRGFVSGVPIELEEAARVDGASRLGAFLRVTFPLVAPGLVATGVFALIQAWNEFVFALVIMNRPENQTLPVWLQAFNEGARGTDWGGVMAGSTVMTMPVIIFFLIVQRRITTGLTAGAVKG
jgi:N,N'-diacetylchitobiose transport system permease protein